MEPRWTMRPERKKQWCCESYFLSLFTNVGVDDADPEQKAFASDATLERFDIGGRGVRRCIGDIEQNPLELIEQSCMRRVAGARRSLAEQSVFAQEVSRAVALV